MILLLGFSFFLFGLIIGSFLNVVIYRINTQKSLGGRSACMSCQNQLSWYELIPLFSFIALCGRCRNCQTKISIQYPLVEFTTGLILSALFIKFQYLLFGSTPIFFITYTYYAFFFSLLIIIAGYDIKHKVIPDNLSLALGILAFCGLFFFSGNGLWFFHLHFPLLLEFLSGPLIAFPFACLWFVSGGTWMGLGDAKLAVGLGWFLGLETAFTAVVIAFWSGAIIGIMLMLMSSNYKMKSEIPFAPYLILGTLLTFLFKLHFFVF